MMPTIRHGGLGLTHITVFFQLEMNPREENTKEQRQKEAKTRID